MVESAAGRLTFEGQNKTATSTDTISVRPTDTGSAITYHARIEFHGLANWPPRSSSPNSRTWATRPSNR